MEFMHCALQLVDANWLITAKMKKKSTCERLPILMQGRKTQKYMTEARFERAPLSRPEYTNSWKSQKFVQLESGALDRSAIQPILLMEDPGGHYVFKGTRSEYEGFTHS
jgi:hypothetical protein